MNLMTFPCEPPDIAGRIDWSIRCLREPPFDCLLLCAVQAIRCLVGTIRHPDRVMAPIAALQAAADLLTTRADEIAAEAAPLDRDYVLAGLQATIRLLALYGLTADAKFTDDVFNQMFDDMDHAVLLSDELDATLCRRRIAAREATGFRPSNPLADYRSAGAAVQ